MEYVTRCFDSSVAWDEDNLYPSITSSSDVLIDFKLPQGLKFSISSLSSPNFANSLGLSNFNYINGSLSYLYSSIDLHNVASSKGVLLQDAIQNYKFIQPLHQLNKQLADHTASVASNRNPMLLYGKLYFPGNILETLFIKKFSSNTKLLVKCLSSKNLKNNGIMTLYLQQNALKYSRELIYSTNESLIGLRFLYNFGSTYFKDANQKRIQKRIQNQNTAFNNSELLINEFNHLNDSHNKFYNHSKFSMGAELWYGILNMSPGLSSSLRYTTYSTYTGKPLTMTLTCNPIIGHLTSSYTVKTSLNSTFSSKFDFNVYSYESNLSLGCELWKYDGNISNEVDKILLNSPDKNSQPTYTNTFDSNNEYKSFTERNISNFKNVFSNLKFSQLLKLSTSLNDRNLNLLYEGKFKDFLFEFGISIKNFIPCKSNYSNSLTSPVNNNVLTQANILLKSNTSDTTNTTNTINTNTNNSAFTLPEIAQIGFHFQYSS
ncbi:Mdm10p ASCRUDRAFT_76016 [Ascoidea rubescens DSM 1968]|uniref:Mitochondrial distribution and morphology protein 10 n=1 Tax=Ascoidea rubescens DSM 1968 TaxID=1344418 RepID=A0A1D2VG12_9ASCO|nr:hypothetical protein ASCRUDRAFT_76016 [Ascoidea rubescens DSM 1968]ODV60618.1 hypothetical protein ASCRUDRAFT_76016 [Ascoidea rubescens DSM 1968]